MVPYKKKMSSSWWDRILHGTTEEVVAIVREDPDMYFRFVRPEYERLRLAFEWNQFPHHKPEDICKRVAENTLELQEACRNAIEELVETLPVEDDRSVLILTQFQNIDLLRRKLRGNSRAVDILLRMKNSTAESLCERTSITRRWCARAHVVS